MHKEKLEEDKRKVEELRAVQEEKEKELQEAEESI